MKTKVLLMGIAITTTIAVSCAQGQGRNNRMPDRPYRGLYPVFTDTEDLTKDEQNMLLFMKEEEKMARDVYTALYEKWNFMNFNVISRAEERHLFEVSQLLGHYDLDTTVAEAGKFSNSQIQKLYNDFVSQGSESIVEAIRVGATIEERDIKDLQTYLDQTSNANIALVFNNLLFGSENNLRAFDRQLQAYGVDYKPQYLDQEQFDAIIASRGTQGQFGMGYGLRQGMPFGPGYGMGQRQVRPYGPGFGAQPYPNRPGFRQNQPQPNAPGWRQNRQPADSTSFRGGRRIL